MDHQQQQQQQQQVVFQQQQQSQRKTASRDAMLMFSSMFLTYDFLGKWDMFNGCPWPLHKWLLASYAILSASRLIMMAISRGSGSSAADALINLRQKSMTVRMLIGATWWVMTPLLVIWSILGTVLTWKVMMLAPQHLPSGLHFVFLMIWQVLSYAWIAAYAYVGLMAWRVENIRSEAERNLRELQDDDTLRRWGSMDASDGRSAFLPTTSMAGEAHLTPAQIKCLPGVRMIAKGDADEDQDCPICLQCFSPTDVVRQLGACGHVFHRSCLDLWLLRAAECPMCKTRVEAAPLSTAA